MYIKKLTEDFINDVNNRQSLPGDRIVTLVKSGEELGNRPVVEFEVRFCTHDPWINQRPYDEGSAIIYLSDQFYQDIDRISIQHFGVKPSWNNTRSNGWVYLKE